MTLMIDRLSWGKQSAMPSTLAAYPADVHREYVDHFMNDIANVDAVLHITNVAEYFFTVSDDEFDTPERDFPNVAPPFDMFWMEFAAPRFWNVKGTIVPIQATAPRRWGVLMRAFPGPNKGWILGAKIVCEWEPGKIVNPLLTMEIPINADGTLADGAWPTRAIAESLSHAEDNLVRLGKFMVKPCLLAISFMHCKNVVMHAQDVPEKLGRAYRRRHGRELIRHHTIHIEPMKKVLATEGGIAENGLKKALHICRGHWAQYGPQYGRGKLFGKIEGQFWIPAHVRGSAEQGVIDKRYVVHPPKDGAA
jgi:hypothetical protein